LFGFVRQTPLFLLSIRLIIKTYHSFSYNELMDVSYLYLIGNITILKTDRFLAGSGQLESIMYFNLCVSKPLRSQNNQTLN